MESYSAIDNSIDINDTNWILIANYIEANAKKVGWDGKYNNQIDIRNSFLFTRMHDMKHSSSTFTKEGNINVLTIFLPTYIKDFLSKHTDFPEKDGAIILSDIYAMKNEQEYKQYIDNIPDIRHILEKVYSAIAIYAFAHINDNEAISLNLAVKTIAYSKTEDYTSIRIMLLRVLLNEKDSGIISLNKNRDYLVIWTLSAWIVNFEEWYEEQFNDKITGIVAMVV